MKTNQEKGLKYEIQIRDYIINELKKLWIEFINDPKYKKYL